MVIIINVNQNQKMLFLVTIKHLHKINKKLDENAKGWTTKKGGKKIKVTFDRVS